MANNQTGIAISIKAFLPMGKTIDEQFEALNIVKTAHETGDYAALLKASVDVKIKTENKTRRVEDKPAAEEPGKTEEPAGERSELSKAFDPEGKLDGDLPEPEEPAGETENVPAFLKEGKRKSA